MCYYSRTLLREPFRHAGPLVSHVSQGCPNPARSSSWPLLGALGLLPELPGCSWLPLAMLAQIQPGAFPGHSWVLLGCSWNFPGPVMPCALCASMQRSCYPRAPNWHKNVRGVWGESPGFLKNPKPSKGIARVGGGPLATQARFVCVGASPILAPPHTRAPTARSAQHPKPQTRNPKP